MNPGPTGFEAALQGNLRFTELLNELDGFHDFLLVDCQKSRATARDYRAIVKRFLESFEGEGIVTTEVVRDYLKRIKEKCSRDHYAITLSALKLFFRDFKRRPDIVETFKFPPKQFKPKTIPSKDDLKRFFEALPSLRIKAYFLLTASSGLRKSEVLSLTLEDVDFEKRMLRPHNHKGTTKHTWISFYNIEAEKILKEFRSSLTEKQRKSDKLIPISSRDFKVEWKIAQEKTGLKLTSKSLRDWFAEEMGRLGVADRYIDALQGRTPASILARHYTDYSPDKLKEIYDRAGIRVLT
ncbi:MAG: tyrosine-type recombinase/integrase [Candidatus Bathyarchaeia archaeon]